VRRVAARARRVCSVCTGAYVLGAAGLLDGRRATTHWAHFDEFSNLFPRVRLDQHALFVNEGRCHSSAGISAGIDYTLALIEADLGRRLALEVARSLVVFLKRPGGQAQFSAPLAAEAAAADPDRFAALTQWMLQNLAPCTSSMRVCQFRHLGMNYNFSPIIASALFIFKYLRLR
jgi:transcriptional regulator GlxA family with amidase domain